MFFCFFCFQKNVVEREKSYVSKNKKSVTSVGSESSIEELSELDDDVIEDAPVVKKGFKSPFKSLKRQASQDSSKVLKRQSTKDNLHGTKKGVYQAKGGGLKSKNTKERKTSEKEERTRTKSSSEKRSGSQSKKQKTPEKTQTSVKTNPPRYETSFSLNNSTKVGLCSSQIITRSYAASLNNRRSGIARRPSHRRSICRNLTTNQRGIGNQAKINLDQQSSSSRHRAPKYHTQLRSSGKITKKSSLRRNKISKSKLSTTSLSRNVKESTKLENSELTKPVQRKRLRKSIGQTSLKVGSKIPIPISERKSFPMNSIEEDASPGYLKKRASKEINYEEPSVKKKSPNKSFPSILVSSFDSSSITRSRDVSTDNDTLNLPRSSYLQRGSRLCPLGIRNRLAVPGMIGRYSYHANKLTGIDMSNRSVFETEDSMTSQPTIQDEKENNLRPSKLKGRRPSRIEQVRLNSVKNKRKSMLRKR